MSTETKMSDALRKEAAPLWEKIHAHPFVRGIGDGTLPLAQFRFYMCQDYIFLKEYSRVIALAVVKAPELAEMGRFADLLNATLNTEMELHRGFAAKFGISADEIEATKPAPTCKGYTDFLLEAAYSGTFGEVAAAMLPCQWDYAIIGELLAAGGIPENAPLHAEWIETYASEEFAQLARWLREMFDEAASTAGPAERERMRAHFLMGTRYEYLFWDMSWKREEWPL